MLRRSSSWKSLTLIGCGLATLVLAAPAVADPPAKADPPKDDVQAAAAKINLHVSTKWKENEITPADRTNDAQFLRRVYLDLVGRIPNIVEVRDFCEDNSPTKRADLVHLLLNPPSNDGRLKDLYVNHFANFWRSGMMPETNDPNLRFGAVNFENWLRNKVRTNTPYDKMVREIFTYNAARGGDQGIQSFYQANEFKAENLAATTSRFFLGNKLECAQCHNHPFAKVSREQFWEYAAFWVGVNQGGARNDAREIAIPGTDKKVTAKFLDGTEPEWKAGMEPRVVLADWLVSPENPYFARTAVNRLWAYFFGLGLHEPVDEPWGGKPTHPELLDELAKEFVAHNYDIKFLIKVIIASDAYQLSSKPTHPSQDDVRWFGKMSVRGLTPEQLFDSLAEAVGYQGSTDPRNPQVDMFGQVLNPRSEFIAKFSSHDKKVEMQTSILQALHLMNGKFMQEAVTAKNSKTLKTIMESNSSTARKISELYKITVSRPPTAAEKERLVKYVDGGGAKGDDSKKALADVLWALLNSSEFALNH